MDIPVNIHTMFFFPAGDLGGSKLTAEGVGESKDRASERRRNLAHQVLPAVAW